MADTKISGLTALTGANTASGDLLTIVDISDTTMAATGTNKNITLTELQSAPVSAGTANGVAYLNGSKVVTTGSALTFDGTNFGISAGSGVSVKNISSATQANLRLGSTFTTGTGGANTDWSLIQSYAVYGDLVFRSGTAEGGDPRTTGSTRFQFLRDGTSIWSVAGSEAMRLTSTGLGIGTSSPGAKLDVNGGTNSEMRLTTSGSGYLQVGQFTNGAFIGTSSSDATAGQLRLGTGGAAQVWLSTAGNLGLGVTPSAWGSAFKSLDIGAYASFWNTSGGTIGVAYNAYHNGTNFIYRASGIAPASYQQSLGTHSWYTAPSGTAGNAITFTQAMTLDASGRLLVGATTKGTYGGNTVEFRGANIANPGSNDTGNLSIFTTDSQAANVGAVIALGGVYSGSTPYAFGAIAARKQSSTSGNAQGYLQFYTTNSDNSITEKARIDSSGNLGLGVTPSAWGSSWKALQVGGGSLWANPSSASNTLHLTRNAYYDGTSYKYIATGTASNYDQDSGSHLWFTAPSGTAGNAITFTQAMTLDASGNLGVGTTSPTAYTNFKTLEIGAGGGTKGGLLRISGASNTVIGYFYADSLAPLLTLGSDTATPLSFVTGGTERARIDSSGNFQVGTAALATTATNGFLYIPTCAGTPTGTPTAKTGLAPIIIDSTNNKMYIYSGGAWVALN